jgi:type II secretory ATPase GspE/PulE/Tfp pilus assembly ATPase PilB-like protein
MPPLSPASLGMDDVLVVPQCALLIPGELALRRLVLPFMEEGGTLLVACADPDDQAALGAVERAAGRPVRAEAAEIESLRRAILRVYGKSARRGSAGRPGGEAGPLASSGGGTDEFVRLVDEVLVAATLREASDIHFEPEGAAVLVRLRIDGHLEDLRRLSPTEWGGVLGRIKVLARMDIAEKRLPQDGQITWENEANGRRFSIRAATVPSRHGEKATLRFLGLHASHATLPGIGMAPEHLGAFTGAIARPHGLVLITGPTGSGKTSTMYAALRHLLGSGPRSLITIEDPVECDLPGVVQISVDGERLTYADALRSVLRHDPDVILIGEIRDSVSADIAVRAALTGHLVLSTLHTHNAAAAITRLRDLGVEPYLLAAVLHLAAAQRLVRRLCPKCRVPRPLDAATAHALRSPVAAGSEAFAPGGCKYCGGTGYQGRLALFEMLPLAPDDVTRIISNPEQDAIDAYRRERGLPSLMEDAWSKIRTGETTPEEVVRTVS